jgi:hypothetical protein
MQIITTSIIPKKARRKGVVTVTIGETPITLYFGKISVGFGERDYFICPKCGRYRSKLAWNGKVFCCMECFPVNVYRGIQQTTRGGSDFITYKMERYAAKHGITIKAYPFIYLEYERPKRKWVENWHKHILILQALESMRGQAIFGSTPDIVEKA